MHDHLEEQFIHGSLLSHHPHPSTIEAHIWVQYLSFLLFLKWFFISLKDYVTVNAETMPYMERRYIPLCINHCDLWNMYVSETDSDTVSERQFLRVFEYPEFNDVHFSRALHIGLCTKCFELESKRR